MTSELRKRLAQLTPEQFQRLASRLRPRARSASLTYSLFFFADRGTEDGPLYDLLIECAKFADKNGFEAIWTPERHFHDFGAPYSAPAVLSAALAMVTDRLKVRAGSVVLPINDTIRVAEAWSIVDNLSRGRIGVSLASGWHPDDFVLSRFPYEERHRVFEEQISVLKKLWRGDAVGFDRGNGHTVKVAVRPRPVQPEIPIWVTTSRSPATWQLAGRMGAHVLTGLMEQSIDQVAELVPTYRSELAKNGFDPSSRQVTAMLHTFVYDDARSDRESVEAALGQYLRSHMKFYETMMSQNEKLGVDLDSLTEEDRNILVRRGVERYTARSAMIGTVAECRRIAQRLSNAGIDEVACLVNFGVPRRVLESGLERLAELARPETTTTVTAEIHAG